MNGGPKFCENCQKVAKQTGKKLDCKNCPDRFPNIHPKNRKAMHAYSLCSNCVNYVSTMAGVAVTGFDWANLKALLELSGVNLTKLDIKRLRLIETLIIEESAKEQRG